jgi:hypothetical protein
LIIAQKCFYFKAFLEIDVKTPEDLNMIDLFKYILMPTVGCRS